MSEERAVLTYGNWRKPESPGIAGLGLAGTALLFVGLFVAVVALAFSPIAGLITAVAVALLLAPLMLKDRHGRNGLQRISARFAWARGRFIGGRSYRSGPIGRARSQRFQLPSIAAAMTAVDATDAHNRTFVLLHHPSTNHVSTVIETSPDGNALVDAEQVDHWVANWGAWLSALGQESGLVGASVTIETAPDAGTRLIREVRSQLVDGAPPLARTIMEEVVASYPAGSASITCRIALTWTMQSAFGGTKKRSLEEMAIEIGNRLPGLTGPLAAAGGGAAAPMTTADLAAAVRVAYDPSVHVLVEEAGPQDAGIEWTDAGPSATHEYADRLWHDGATSVTWAMTGAPRGQVFSNVLAKILGPHRDIARKRVTLLYRPHDAGLSATLVESDRRNAAFTAQGGARRAVSARSLVSVASAEQAAREEARGAGLVRFGMLVTATVLDADRSRVRQVESIMDSLATASRIVLRRLWGSQSAGFLGALPLGLVLPVHLKVPEVVRKAI